MKNVFWLILPLIVLTACNTVSIKPHTLDKSYPIYVDTNGETIRHYLKEELETRGYDVTIGTKSNIIHNITNNDDDKDGIIASYNLNNARYVAQVNEYAVNENIATWGRVFCVFNGFKWWNFSLSISDNTTGKEILNWSGIGCKNIVKSHLKELLDELENTK